MSTQTGAFNTHSSTTYRYAIVAALGVVALIGCVLFFRSRIIEHRHPTTRIVRNLGEAIQEKPRFYEAYLGSGGLSADCEWGEVMPLSVYRIGPSSWSQSATKRVSHDGGELLGSVPSKLAIFIGMPFSHMHTEGIRQESSGDAVPEEDPPLPYLEIGITGLDVPRHRDNLDSGE
ncbi:hypothetical protein C8R44DRAFT_754253 [Mycena epipterygia]|nr:hypothetical protein C8R44DRAFT_754253 [Mycena epipterygia]